MQGEIHNRRQGSSRRHRTRAQQVQSRRFTLVVCLLVVMVAATAGASYSSRAAAGQPAFTGAERASSTTLDPAASLVSATYKAELDDASGGTDSPRALLELDYDADTETISYLLEITYPLANPSVAALCQGSPGQSGSTVFTVFTGPTISGKFSGVLAQGQIEAADLVGPLQGQDIADLVLLIQAGNVYATVGTAGIPIDAIRGQIE